MTINRGVLQGIKGNPFARIIEAVYPISSSGTKQVLPDPVAWPKTRMRLTANCNIVLPSPAVGQRFTLALVQDSVGNRLATFTGTVAWTRGIPPSLSTQPGEVDYLDFDCTTDGVWDGVQAVMAVSFIVVPVTADYTATTGQIVEVDATGGPVSITVPITKGHQVVVKKMDTSANAVLIVPASGAIDGGPNVALQEQYGARWAIGNGTVVDIIGERKPFGSPVALGGPNADGSSTLQSRTDHVHEIRITPTSVPTAGTSQTINLSSKDMAVVDVTLSASSCALTFSGFPSSRWGQANVRIHQDASTGGKKITFTDTIIWAEGYPPVLGSAASAMTAFTIYSLDGGSTFFGTSGQVRRVHTLRISGALAVSTGVDREYFDYDARIVKVRPSVGVTPVSTAMVADIKKGAGQAAAGTTIYSTTGNRPSVAAGNYTNTSQALPDTVDIAPGDFLTADCITPSSASALALAVTTLEPV